MRKTYISKTDLAQAFFPFMNERAARHKLMLQINRNSQLLAELVSTGYTQSSHDFSPLQTEKIFAHLGNPFQ